MVRTRSSDTMGIGKSSSAARRKGILITKSPTIRKHGGSKEKSKKKKSNIMKGTPPHLVGKEKSRKRKKKKNMIQVGDTVNLSDLLFTNYRDYLIVHRHNNRRVKATDLAGKVIVLHFMSLRNYFDTWRAPVINIRDIYTKLHPKGDFEIVFVALGLDNSDYRTLIGSNTRECFREVVSMMPPCPAIPLSDRKSIKRLERIFGFGSERFQVPVGPKAFIIDPTGVVLQSYATPLLLRYGAAGFPFTNERIQFLDSEDNLIRRQPFSVEKYLASPERDYLINNKGERVPLHDIDDKVVGLYFCPCLHGLMTTRELQMVYQELSKHKEDFEIVLIYTHGWCEHEDTCGLIDEDSFLDEIKTMPWLALPFTDTDCNKKLQRIFQNPQDLEEPKPAASLVIIGPHGKFIEPLATNILAYYGAPAYPFTLQSASDLELEKVKNLRPDSLWNLDAMFTRIDGSQVQFSEVVGKRIIVLYQTSGWRGNYETLGKLRARYFMMKGTDDEFEVIHIHRDTWYGYQFQSPMPWLMHPRFDLNSYADKFMYHVFRQTGGLLAFNRDGLVVRMTTHALLGDSKVFPFYHGGDMRNEVFLDVKYKILSRLESVFQK
ncbi:hypothetical protein OROGR_002104 [Orobanche gracilis]